MTAPYQRHSPTSRAAARQIEHRSATLKDRVLRCIESAGSHGMTDEEIQRALFMGGNTQRPRRRELEQACQISDSGRSRKNRSGRYATVWICLVIGGQDGLCNDNPLDE